MVYRRNLKVDEANYYLAMANRPRKSNASSKYRGVHYSKNRGKWQAIFNYAGVRYYVGSYETELEAARAYNVRALAVVGEHAILNDLPNE